MSGSTQPKCWTVFVANLQRNLHWKGVWQVFDRHGVVVDVFISKKLAKDGSRFGFVRMRSKGDAERVIERFSGFWLYGSRVRVSMSQRERASFWRKKREDPLSQKQTITNRYETLPLLDNKEFDGKENSRRRVIGEVEEEKLEILRFCAVGYCRRQCSVLDLAKEFRAAGLEGFTVMRVSGSLVLLIFLNEEQRRSILDKDVLQQWLKNVMEWSPGLQLPNRRVWVSAWGIPMHAWSEATFKRIAALWGDLVSVDSGTLAPVSFERAHFLIETDRFAHIDEMIEFEAKVTADKNEKSTEMLEIRDSSRVEESLRKASLEETVVPNSVSHGVDSVEMEWSNEEEAGLVNRFDNSPSNNDGLQEIDIQEKIGREGLGDIVPFEAYSDVSSPMQHGGKGRPKKNQIQTVANESLSDSDIRNRKQVILKEARETVNLGKLIGATTLGNEEAIVKDIARIIEAREKKLMVKRVWYTDNYDFVFAPAVGKAGGILIVWDSTRFQVSLKKVEMRFAVVEGTWLQEDWLCGVIGVYAPCVFEEQIRLWDDLGGFLDLSQQSWCVCGDFNMVLKLEERRGCSTIPRGMAEFGDFIENIVLIDFPLCGKGFTWFGSGNRCSRIDRVLVTSAWCERFDQLRVRSLPRGLSDHTPLLLQNNVINGGPHPFRFINAWMAEAKNVKLLGAEWVRLKENDAENSLIQRLKRFKVFLRDWNLSSFGDVDCNITKVTKQIEDLDTDCRAAGESEEVAEKRKLLQGELACVIDFGKNWEKCTPLVEFSYNNNYQSLIQIAPIEALYGRSCRTPLCWFELVENKVLGPQLIQETEKQVRVIHERLKQAFDKQKAFVDMKRRDIHYNVGDIVFLKVSHSKKVLRFGKNGKLSLYYNDPFEVIERIGPVANRFTLPPEFEKIHNVFHISILRRYRSNPSHILEHEEVELNPNLSYEEEPAQIHDREIKRLRNNNILLVKVLYLKIHDLK
ncbi:hypothetical protein GQ457_11G028430 [Hibiscus cannabinus]